MVRMCVQLYDTAAWPDTRPGVVDKRHINSGCCTFLTNVDVCYEQTTVALCNSDVVDVVAIIMYYHVLSGNNH